MIRPGRRDGGHHQAQRDGTAGGATGAAPARARLAPAPRGLRRAAACVLASLMAIASGPIGAQAPDDSMRLRIKACTPCHGDEGRAGPDGYYPRLAGKPADYLFEQMLAFRDGRRRYALMTHLLDPLSEAYLRELAATFAALELPHAAPRDPPPDARRAERAEQLARRGDPSRELPACADCHGERLTGVLPAVPSLLGLSRDYVNAQLGAWRSGTRRSREPDCMAQIARRLGDDDIVALSAWLASQPMPQPPGADAGLPRAMPLRCGTPAARLP